MSKVGASVSSTQGKLEVLRRHYEELGKVSVDDNFEADWKEEVVSTLETCSENVRLDRQIYREEIAQCVKKLKKTRLGGVMEYGSSGMVCLLEQLFSVVWCEELFLGSGGRDLLLIYLRKGIKRTRVIIEVLRY